MKKKCCLILLTLALSISAIPRNIQQAVTNKSKASSYQVSAYPGGYLAPYVVLRDQNGTFKELVCFWVTYLNKKDEEQDNRESLIPDAKGFIRVGGRLIARGDATYPFKEAKLRETGAVKENFIGGVLRRTYRDHPITLTFVTDQVNGISYQFDGEYLDEPKEENGEYIHLKGKLMKFKSGRKIAEAILKLTPNVTE